MPQSDFIYTFRTHTNIGGHKENNETRQANRSQVDVYSNRC